MRIGLRSTSSSCCASHSALSPLAGTTAAAPAYGLASNYQSLAVRAGLSIVRGSWRACFAAVRSTAARRAKHGLFSDAERHEVNWLLLQPAHLATILAGGVVIPTGKDNVGPHPDLVDNDHARIDRWLEREIRRQRGGQPSVSRRLAFELDNTLFSVAMREGGHFPTWIRVAGLSPGKRIRIPLAGTDLAHLTGTANLRVSIERDTRGRRRAVFSRAEKTAVAERAGTDSVGIDKGAGIAVVATASDAEHAVHLGADAGSILARRSRRSFRRGRSRYASRADNLAGHQTRSGQFHGNPKPTVAQRRKAARIRRNNLGSSRRDNEQRRGRAEIENANGRAARLLVETFPDASTFYEEKLNFRGSDRRKARTVNRFLNRWAKRDLSRRIELHVLASGARREFVNAAHTSQACPRCHWTDRGNRIDTAFACPHCGYAGHADSVASSNVRERGTDREIGLFTPHQRVKQILLTRHERWWNDVATADAGVRPGDPFTHRHPRSRVRAATSRSDQDPRMTGETLVRQAGKHSPQKLNRVAGARREAPVHEVFVGCEQFDTPGELRDRVLKLVDVTDDDRGAPLYP